VGGAAAVGDAPNRLELARGILRRVEDRSTSVQPVVAAESDARLLPVVEPLARLLPSGGLRRGSTVALPAPQAGASLLLALLAEASAAGGWVGVVGRPGLGLVAAAEAGVRLERLALVPEPGADLLAVTIALLEGMDIVVVAGPALAGVRAADRQRLAARARRGGAVLVALGPWRGADVELRCTDAQWHGPDAGAGRLCARQVRVQSRGRGLAPGGRWARLMLPARDRPVAPAEAAEPVERIDRVMVRAAG
jgi:hypothetical protein